MKVKNKETGEVEAMRYGAAMDAVTAGTHEIVNEDSEAAEAVDDPKAAKPRSRKAAE